uniref:Uncharacterized protein n=1 Tax=Pipistrellus kuhlii TaxID=59472 RepID=A0A7J7XV90_PIPKU|nr:hypothetical protein mPipKuh1_010424 [Pipistrellus kuhlii]
MFLSLPLPSSLKSIKTCVFLKIPKEKQENVENDQGFFEWLNSNKILHFKSTKWAPRGRPSSPQRCPPGQAKTGQHPRSQVGAESRSPSFFLQHLIRSLGPVLFNDAELPFPLRWSSSWPVLVPTGLSHSGHCESFRWGFGTRAGASVWAAGAERAVCCAVSRAVTPTPL